MFKTVSFFIALIAAAFVIAPKAHAEGCTDEQRLRAEIDAYQSLDRLRDFNDGQNAFSSANEGIALVEQLYAYAKKCGADLERINRTKLDRVETAARAAFAKKSVHDLALFVTDPSHGSAADWYIAMAESAVEDARTNGADVAELAASLPKLVREARKTDAERRFAELQKFAKGGTTQIISARVGIEDAQHAINEARELRVALPPTIEKQLPEVSRQALLRDQPTTSNN